MATKTKEIPLNIAIRGAMDRRPGKWLSEISGIQPSEISRILTGRLRPSEGQLAKINKALNTSFVLKDQ